MYSGGSEILYEIGRDTTRISSCFSDFRVVSWNPHYIVFSFQQCIGLFRFRNKLGNLDIFSSESLLSSDFEEECF